MFIQSLICCGLWENAVKAFFVNTSCDTLNKTVFKSSSALLCAAGVLDDMMYVHCTWPLCYCFLLIWDCHQSQSTVPSHNENVSVACQWQHTHHSSLTWPPPSRFRHHTPSNTQNSPLLPPPPSKRKLLWKHVCLSFAGRFSRFTVMPYHRYTGLIQ